MTKAVRRATSSGFRAISAAFAIAFGLIALLFATIPRPAGSNSSFGPNIAHADVPGSSGGGNSCATSCSGGHGACASSSSGSTGNTTSSPSGIGEPGISSSIGSVGNPVGPGGTAGGTGGSSGGSVICTELRRQGLLPDDLYAYDLSYGWRIVLERPAVYLGYRLWAGGVVQAMRAYPSLARAIAPVVRFSSGEMKRRELGERGSPLWGALFSAGELLCAALWMMRGGGTGKRADGENAQMLWTA